MKEANYPVEHNDRFMRNLPVLGMKSDRVRKDCFKVGNGLTFKEVIWQVTRVGRQTASANEYRSAVHQFS